LVDTNVLAYAVNRDCEENRAAVAVLDDWLSGSVPWALTWSIVYEFLRLTTHPRVFRRPLAATDAVAFLTPLLESELVSLLTGPGCRRGRDRHHLRRQAEGEDRGARARPAAVSRESPTPAHTEGGTRTLG